MTGARDAAAALLDHALDGCAQGSRTGDRCVTLALMAVCWVLLVGAGVALLAL